VAALEKAGAHADKKTLLVAASPDETLLRAAGNVERLRVNAAGALQVFDVLNADVLVFERAAIDKVQQLYAPKTE
jgi:large subunit ribosomal protein L4